MSEPTVHRRIWAAYLQAGFTRYSWAAALDLSYVAIDNLDTGKSAPRLETLIRMVELLDGAYTIDDLVYGHRRPKLRRAEPNLSDAQIQSLAFELTPNADPQQRAAAGDATEALGIYLSSDAGRFVRPTRTFVAAFLERYRLARIEGMAREAAIDAAKQVAINAQAMADAAAAGVRPVSTAMLHAAGQELKARDAERTGVIVVPARNRRPRQPA